MDEINGFSEHWPTLKKLLIDNNLEHAAQLAIGTKVELHVFVARARAAYRRTMVRLEDLHEAQMDARAQAAREVEQVVERAVRSAAKEEAEVEPEPAKVPKVDPEIAANLPTEPTTPEESK